MSNQDWTELEGEAQRILVERYSPPGFLVDSDQNVILFFGDTSAYVSPAPGHPSFHVAKLIHRKLLPYVEAMVNAATTSEQPSHKESIEFEDRDDKIIMEAIPISTSTRRQAGFLILLHRTRINLGERALRQPEDEWSRLRREVELMRSSVTSLAERRYTMQVELEKVRAERQQALTSLQRAVGQILKAQDNMQKSIALDLHDVFSQRLASLGLKLDALATGNASEDVAGAIAAAKKEIEDFAEYVHDVSRRLHPALVEQLGLKAALMDECERWSQENNIPLDCVIENLPDSLPEGVAVALYRVAHEALHNISKHADASSARIRVRIQGGTITLSVEDFGRGFDVRTREKGLGLIIMEERVRAINGRFTSNSQIGRGTIVEAVIPI